MGKKITAGNFLIQTLSKAGIKRIYGVAGDSLNAVTDSIRENHDVRWIHARHEEVAAFAAGADADLIGGLSVCAGSCGPGNLHLINGLYDCQRSRVPVLAIAAQIPSSELGTNYFQETDPKQLFKDCSHYCELVSKPEDLPRLLSIAVRTALAKKGVSVLIIPGDVALKDFDAPELQLSALIPETHIAPSLTDLQKAAEILNQSKRIAILAGAGCAGAHPELLKIAGTLKAPIIHTLRGKEHVEFENPYDVGMTGLLGFSSGYHAMKECDALLVLGADFPYIQFFPTEAKIIQVDSRGEQIGRRSTVHLGLIGNVKDTVHSLLPLLSAERDGSYLEKSAAHYKNARRELDELATVRAGDTALHPQFVTQRLSDLASENAVFTCDVGTPTVWAARYLKMNGKRRLLGSFNHGSMANAMPQAIGAQAAEPGRQIIAMCGDGGFSMLMGDLLTLKQENLPIKIIIFNNGSLGFVELEMKAAGFVTFATDLKNPSFAAIAEACGVFGQRVEKPEDLEGALRRALEHDGPAVVDVVTYRQELSMPPAISLEQAKGFSLYMMRAILNGRGSEIVDLAKTNLFR